MKQTQGPHRDHQNTTWTPLSVTRNNCAYGMGGKAGALCMGMGLGLGLVLGGVIYRRGQTLRPCWQAVKNSYYTNHTHETYSIRISKRTKLTYKNMYPSFSAWETSFNAQRVLDNQYIYPTNILKFSLNIAVYWFETGAKKIKNMCLFMRTGLLL